MLAQADDRFHQPVVHEGQSQLDRRGHGEPLALGDSVLAQIGGADPFGERHVDVGPGQSEVEEASGIDRCEPTSAKAGA